MVIVAVMVHFRTSLSDELSQPNVAGTGLDVGGEVGFYLNRDRCAGAVPTCVVLYNESYENEGEQIEKLGKHCRQRQRDPLPNKPTPTAASFDCVLGCTPPDQQLLHSCTLNVVISSEQLAPTFHLGYSVNL